MSIRINQRSNSRNSEFSKLNEQSSGIGSCATLQNDPATEFEKMKEAIHNLFQLAKKEIALLYRVVLREVAVIGHKARDSRKMSQLFLQRLNQIKKQAEFAASTLSDKLTSVLVFPETLKKLCSSLAPQLYEEGPISTRHEKKRAKTSFSLNKEQSSSDFLMLGLSRQTKKITSKDMKKLESLQFLQGIWPNLQTIEIEGKGLSSLCQFSKVRANYLQHINLPNNQIPSLKPLKSSTFPFLFQLNLSKNRIKQLQGIHQANLPRLVILNLSKNFINSLQMLTSCNFGDLLQLHLQGNRIEDAAALNSCNFSKLEILNLDDNRITNVSSFCQLPFYALKMLSFSKNQIGSIQFASKACFPRLQGFIGHNNKIKSLEPLVNASFPCLRQIVLHNNEIDDISCVKRMKFPKLTGFDIEHNKIQVKSVGCFLTSDKGCRQSRKKFPFILI